MQHTETISREALDEKLDRYEILYGRVKSGAATDDEVAEASSLTKELQGYCKDAAKRVGTGVIRKTDMDCYLTLVEVFEYVLPESEFEEFMDGLGREGL